MNTYYALKEVDAKTEEVRMLVKINQFDDCSLLTHDICFKKISSSCYSDIMIFFTVDHLVRTFDQLYKSCCLYSDNEYEIVSYTPIFIKED